MNKKIIIWIFACLVTTVAVCMAAAAAWDLGTGIYRALFVAMSILICAGTHLIPATLWRSKLSRVVWVGCLAGTIFGHVNFFTNANLLAGVVRAQTSTQVIGVQKQLDAEREALASLTARSVTTVAEELSQTRQRKRKQVLSLELAEAKRAAQLRDDIVRLSNTVVVTTVTASANPVIAVVARVTGSNPQIIELAVWLGFAVLLELIGVLAWRELLGRPEVISQDTGHPSATGDSLDELKDAIATGRCKLTVVGIREFMGCGQDRAMMLRRQLVDGSNNNND